MVDARKYFGLTYAALKDVADGPSPVDIDRVAEDSKFGKLVAVFTNNLALSLNATNTRTLTRAYGPETDYWVGRTIELYTGEVEFSGKPQPAVLVRPISPPLTPEEMAATAKLSKAAANGGDMGDEDIPF